MNNLQIRSDEKSKANSGPKKYLVFGIQFNVWQFWRLWIIILFINH